MGTVEPLKESAVRLKRVKRLKKFIIISVLTLIFVPLALCIYFGCAAYSMKLKLAETVEELNYYLELVSEASFSEESIEKDDNPVMEAEPALEVIDPVQEETFAEVSKVNSSLSDADVKRLSLSDEELYDGYRKIYLTFDDGPSPKTDDILDILNEYGVKGTFFVVKREGSFYENLYRRIVDEGHSLGMHSTSHVYREIYKDVEAFRSDTNELRNYLYLVTGAESDIYRFPGGSSNKVSPTDMHVFADELAGEGIVFFDWNVSAGDASSVKATKDEIVRNVTSRLKSYDDVIVLFHDLDSKDTTVEALPEIIEYIQNMENTVILPLSRDSNPIHHLSVK